MNKIFRALALTLVLPIIFTTGVYAQAATPAFKTIAENLPYGAATIYPYASLIYVTKDDLCGYLDYDGKVVIPVQYKALSYQNGYILAKDNGDAYTLYDDKGNVKMDTTAFEKASVGGYTPDSLTIAKDIVGMGNGSKYKLVDFNGNELTNLTKLLSNSKPGTVNIEEDLIRIREDNGTSYFVDRNGNAVLPEENENSYMDFSDGVVLKIKRDPLRPENVMATPLAFYDTKGQLVCNVPDVGNGADGDVEFSQTDLATLLQFSEGYAAYRDKNTKLVGFIDKTGKIVIPAKFDRCVLKFENGTAGVHLPNDDKLSYIGTKGDVLFSVPAPSPWPHGNTSGLFVNTYNAEQGDHVTNKVVACDRKGNQIFSSETTYQNGDATGCVYTFGSGPLISSQTVVDIEVEPYTRTAIMQTTDHHYGLYDLSGNEILPLAYSSIQPLESSDGRLLLSKEDKLSIIQITPNGAAQTTTASVSATPEYSCKGIITDEGLSDGYTYTFASGQADFYPGDCLLMVNGSLMPNKAINKNGTAFVPISVIAKTFGTDVKWDDKTKQVTVNGENTKINMTIGHEDATINGTSQKLTAAPFITDGLTYVPLRFISEAMGKSVGYVPAFKPKDYPCKDLLAYHAVVWVDDTAAINNTGETNEQTIAWVKEALGKALDNMKPNLQTYHDGMFKAYSQSAVDEKFAEIKTAISSTAYIGQIGRYAFLKSAYPILVDVRHHTIYIINLQHEMGAIYQADINSTDLFVPQYFAG